MATTAAVLLIGSCASAWAASDAWAQHQDLPGLYLAALSFFMGLAATRLFAGEKEDQ